MATPTHAVLITGAASGIGAGLAAELARAGHHVIVSDLTATTCERGRGADPGRRAARPRRWRSTSPRTTASPPRWPSLSRPVDVLVNNAGLQHVAPLEEFPMARWDFLVQVMLTGVARLTRAVLPGMRERGFGRIVNIGSIHSLVASPYKSAYVAAKHGLVGFSKAIALETADVDITINTICPSYVKTPLVDKQIADQARIRGIPESEVIEPDHAQADAQGRVHRHRRAGRDHRLPGLAGRAQHHRPDDRRRRRLDGAVS